MQCFKRYLYTMQNTVITVEVPNRVVAQRVHAHAMARVKIKQHLTYAESEDVAIDEVRVDSSQVGCNADSTRYVVAVSGRTMLIEELSLKLRKAS